MVYDSSSRRLVEGNLLENRSFSSDTNRYKFTNKERDNESSYDYFGARYYDSRIGNWGSVDPLFEKHWQLSPYNYTLRNPLLLVDPDGRQIRFSSLFTETGGNLKEILSNLGKFTGANIFTDDDGFLRAQVNFSPKTGQMLFGRGSQTARKYVMGMLSVPQYSLNVSALEKKGSFGLNKTSSMSEINLDPNQINNFMFKGLDRRTMGWAMVLIEEFLHTQYGLNLGHPKGGIYADAAKDPILVEMNQIRGELEEIFGVELGESNKHMKEYS